MPGSSLWLLPPKSHPLYEIISNLITSTLPSLFPDIILPAQSNASSTNRGMDSTFFGPHMTLTSDIPPSTYGNNPQQWLDSIPLPPVTVRFAPEGVQSQDVYFRRCFIKVRLDKSVRLLAGIARARGVFGEEDIEPRTEKWLEWWRREFGPHVSLIYGDVPIYQETLSKITAAVERAGVDLGSSGTMDGERNGWDGGTIWLVPTDRPVREWKPIASREL